MNCLLGNVLHIFYHGCKFFSQPTLANRSLNPKWWTSSRLWFLKLFLVFTPYLGRWSNLTFAYVSNGLVQPPTSHGSTLVQIPNFGQKTGWVNSYLFTRWWFQICLMFTPTWGRFPFWLIFVKGGWNSKPTTKSYFFTLGHCSSISAKADIVSGTRYRSRCFMFDLKGADCWATTFTPWNFDPPQKNGQKQPPWNEAAKPLHLKNGCWNAWKMTLLMKCLFGASST